MIQKLIKLSIIGIHCLIASYIFSHGFAEFTPLLTSEGWFSIQEIVENIRSEEMTYSVYRCTNLETKEYDTPEIVNVMKSETNCTIWLIVGPYFNDRICCTPSQEFYLPLEQQWRPAYALAPGDTLLSKYGTYIELRDVVFSPDPRTVYSICVTTHPEQDNAWYFVGHQMILTHNMCLPAATVAVSIPWDILLAGGACAIELGPATLGVSVAIAAGAGLGYSVYRCIQRSPELKPSTLIFDKETIATQVYNKQESQNAQENEKPKKEGRAPGKPTEQDGYTPPKQWDGEKVKHPQTGQVGYPDNRGRIWVPTGEGGLAHGGPHWDVIPVKSRGQKVDIYPGGRKR